jgi:malate synthase
LEVNIDVGIQYLEAWIGGNGCVPIYNLMEDAATAEISRAQLWQWAHHGARMADGTRLDVDLVLSAIPRVLERLSKQVGQERFDRGHFPEAADLFGEMTRKTEFPEFLTLAAYDYID